jgi:hypothetical protein
LSYHALFFAALDLIKYISIFDIFSFAEEKVKASATKSPPSTSDVSHMTDDEINNAVS